MTLCHTSVTFNDHSHMIIHHIQEYRRFQNNNIIQHVYYMLTL